jgi:hypothetical protein
MTARAHEYDDTDATLDDFWSSDAAMQAVSIVPGWQRERICRF